MRTRRGLVPGRRTVCQCARQRYYVMRDGCTTHMYILSFGTCRWSSTNLKSAAATFSRSSAVEKLPMLVCSRPPQTSARAFAQLD
jgi:hypothetical protein